MKNCDDKAPNSNGMCRESEGRGDSLVTRVNNMGLDTLRHIAQTYLPSEAYRYQQLKRRSKVFEETGIIFIHVPKNAGTSISHAAYGRFVGHIWSSDVDRWGNARLKSLPRFSVVRNPWDRCLSAYNFARADRSGGVEQSLQKISRPERYKGPEFRTFSDFLHLWLSDRDLGREDQVFRPQVTFLRNGQGRVELDFIGRVEDMERVAKYLSSMLSRPILIGRKNATSSQKRDYRDFYSQQERYLVGRIYAEDIDTFEYRF